MKRGGSTADRVAHLGMDKTRRDWAVFYDITYHQLMYQSHKLGDIHQALGLFKNEREQAEQAEKWKRLCITFDALFRMAMNAFTARSLTCNERVM